jgi:hypothetical protein
VLNTAHSDAVAYDLPYTADARILWGTGRGNYHRNGLSLVTSPEKGDLNGDGTITTTDVIIALQIAVSGGYRSAADMDENRYVLDARVILQAVVDRFG